MWGCVGSFKKSIWKIQRSKDADIKLIAETNGTRKEICDQESLKSTQHADLCHEHLLPSYLEPVFPKEVDGQLPFSYHKFLFFSRWLCYRYYINDINSEPWWWKATSATQLLVQQMSTDGGEVETDWMMREPMLLCQPFECSLPLSWILFTHNLEHRKPCSFLDEHVCGQDFVNKYQSRMSKERPSRAWAPYAPRRARNMTSGI